MITCPYCNSDHENLQHIVNDGEQFNMKCDYCGRRFRVTAWIEFDTRKTEEDELGTMLRD